MPKEAKKSGKTAFGDYSFIDYALSARDKEWLGAADLAKEFPLERVVDLVSVGYKFSLSPDFNNMSIVATLTDKQENSPTFKRILSGRGATTLDAWYSLAYRHFVVAKEDWTAFLAIGEGDDSRFG